MNKCAIFFACFLFYGIQVFAGPVILVTGGAGYIGSHTCKALKEAGYLPVAYDSLALGLRESVKWGPLVAGDLLDKEKLDKAFETYQPVAVVHFAGFCNVGESVKNPLKYYLNNVVASINLLDAMRKHGVKHLVFSSSCTVYGAKENAIDESSPKNPTNPYAFSKYAIEKMIQDFSKAYGLHYVIFRYFNAAGMDLDSGLSRSESTHFLIPKALLSLLKKNEQFEVFGLNYPTPDGSAIRDYIHVKDLSMAHVLAFDHLFKGKGNLELNLGTGKGYSVLEVIQAVESVTGKKLCYEVKPRRLGDVPASVANANKAKEVLNFEPVYSNIKTIIETEWATLNRKP